MRGDTGYQSEPRQRVGRFHVTDLHVQIRRTPKPVVAMVAGYAIGGGHVLHVVCDLTIAAENARFGQTGPRVGSFDGGYGASVLAAPDRPEAREGDLVAVPPVRRAAGARLGPRQRRRAARAPRAARPSRGAARCSRCRRFALRLLKASFNAAEDGLAGIQQLAHDANLLFYASEEAREGRTAFVEKRPPDFSRFPRRAVRIWLMAARPRTLPAAIAPVLVGTSLAIRNGPFHPLAFVAALLGAVLIQIGTNLSNDYSDARRGADTEDRIGPVRVTAGGLLPPHRVLVATYLTFGAAVLCGVYLIAVAGWLLLAVGAASILAGVLYTGGPRPYGYEGLGELFVFLFFGLVAVTGSYYVQRRALPWEAFVLAVPVGLLIAAILVVNNVRDIETDRRAGKRTLAVRLGRERTRVLFTAMVALAFVELVGAVVRGRALPLAAGHGRSRRRSRCAHRARRAHARRRAVAQRRARGQRAARARLLRAAVRRRPGAADGAVARARRAPLRGAAGDRARRPRAARDWSRSC